MPLNFKFQNKKFNTIDICGLIKKIGEIEHKRTVIETRTAELENLIGVLDKNADYHFISVTGGFDCVNFIDFIAKREHVEKMLIATLRVGDTEIKHIGELCDKGLIDSVDFVVSKTFARVDKKYKYFNFLKETAQPRNWKIAVVNNHSKVILFKTKENYYVLETSANLNTNVKLEQFSLICSKELWEFYNDFYGEIIKGSGLCES